MSRHHEYPYGAPAPSNVTNSSSPSGGASPDGQAAPPGWAGYPPNTAAPPSYADAHHAHAPHHAPHDHAAPPPAAGWQAAPQPAVGSDRAGSLPGSGGALSISNRSLYLAGGGALGALALLYLARNSRKLKPGLTAALKEAYGLKEWLLGEVETLTADVQDAAAEARHASDRERELEKILETLIEDSDLQQKLREVLAKKIANPGER